MTLFYQFFVCVDKGFYNLLKPEIYHILADDYLIELS